MKNWFLAALLLPVFAFAGVNLLNDSAYPLRAVIRGNDGSYLGEMVVQPQHVGHWNTTYGVLQQSDYATLPYTVLWYCLDGSDYSIWVGVSTGATVTAQGGQGTRICKPRHPGSQGAPLAPPGGYLQPLPAIPEPPTPTQQ